MEKFLTLPEVLELTRVSYTTLSRYWKAGLFPRPLLGRGKKLVFDPEAVSAWLQAQQQVAPPNIIPPSQLKRETKAWNERQQLAKATLAKHAEGRKQNFQKPK